MVTTTTMTMSRAAMIERMLASDPADNGTFIVGVRTTGVYCLPSCRPPRKPKPENVDFFATPEEARAAGLRACKLCRPDEFYMGHDASEALVEGLVAEMNREPGRFRNASAVVSTSGVSASKLHELFRTYYHSTPADMLARARVAAARRLLLDDERRPIVEIAYEVGFESLSAFNRNFRRYSAMAPQAYRKMVLAPRFDLALPVGYPVECILGYLGRDRESLTERVEGHTLTTALRLSVDAVARVALLPGMARCEVMAPARLSVEDAALLHERLLAMLGLTTDPLRFETQVAGLPPLAGLIDGQRGLRVPLIGDPFDALVWAIVGQQINLPFAFRLRRRLVELVGRAVAEGLFAPPSPAAIAALAVDDLLPLQFSRSKAAYLIDAARAVVDNTLPLESLAGASATRIERTLLATRGIGPWSAHYVMMRSFGFLDCVPLGDTGLTAGLKSLFALDERPDRTRTVELMRQFSPYRSLATFHLWHRLGAAA